MDAPKYPHIKVSLVGEDGNAFSILGRVTKAMRRGKCTEEQVKEFMSEATTGDYDHLLVTVMKYVDEDTRSAEEEVAEDFSELSEEEIADEFLDDEESLEDEYADEDEDELLEDLEVGNES